MPLTWDSSLSSQPLFMATHKYASSSLLGSLFSVPCIFIIMLFSITFLDLEAVKAQLAREKGSWKPSSYTHFLLCRLPSWQVVWLRRPGTSRRLQSDSWSRTQHFPILVASPSGCISASTFLCFCSKFVLFTPTAKQTNPLLDFYFITKMFHLRN